MSEGGDYEESSSYDPSHNFADARASFADHAGRSYDEARQSGKTAKDLLPEMLRTDCLRPLVVICDETGSMGTAPGIIFSKAPYLKHEAQTEYLGDDAEISFGAFGDAPNGETYPVQARPFAATGGDIKKRIEELVIEGDGGGTKHESS